MSGPMASLIWDRVNAMAESGEEPVRVWLSPLKWALLEAEAGKQHFHLGRALILYRGKYLPVSKELDRNKSRVISATGKALLLSPQR